MDKSHLVQLAVNFTAFNYDAEFDEPFNSCTFFNYDTAAIVEINKIKIPPALNISGQVYPTSFTVALNVGEYNTTNFSIAFNGSTNANLQIVYTQYLGLGA